MVFSGVKDNADQWGAVSMTYINSGGRVNDNGDQWGGWSMITLTSGGRCQ
jgi:hypothetical protein